MWKHGPMRWGLIVAALLALVLLAGCQAPSATAPSPSPVTSPVSGTTSTSSGPDAGTAERSANVTVVGGTLPVDANRTFVRVQRLLQADVVSPTVRVEENATLGTDTLAARQDPFEEVFGVGPARPAAESDLAVGGATTPDDRVFLVDAGGEAHHVERTLAHEFTHVVQFRQGVPSEVGRNLSPDRSGTTDTAHVRRAVIEGGAVYVADRYVRQYLPGGPTEQRVLERLYANASTGTRLYWSAYLYGARYVDGEIDSPAELGTVYGDPPATTEQLLHRTDDEPVALSVTRRGSDSPWTVTDRDSRGELSVRVLLRGELPAPVAREAAAGWGNDRLVTFEHDGRRGFAWALRWDDRANATEFAAAADRFLTAFATPTGDGWLNGTDTFRTVRTDDRTVVLLAGDPSFVSGAEVSGEPGRLVIEPPQD